MNYNQFIINCREKNQCESKNHSKENCKGEIISCLGCGKKICEQEGSSEYPEFCDNCYDKIIN